MAKTRQPEPATFAWRLKLAMDRREVTQQQVAEAVGMQQPSISKLIRRPSANTTAIARIAAYLGVPPLWLELGEGTEPDWDERYPPSGGTHTGGQVDHHLIHKLAIIEPQVFTLESIMSGAVLAKRFMLKIEDDAMACVGAGSLEPGHFAIFETEREPTPGRNVLLADKTGFVCIRQYHVRRPGHWVAIAANPAYQPMDSAQDGLRVLAAQTGHLY